MPTPPDLPIEMPPEDSPPGLTAAEIREILGPPESRPPISEKMQRVWDMLKEANERHYELWLQKNDTARVESTTKDALLTERGVPTPQQAANTHSTAPPTHAKQRVSESDL